MSKSGDVLIIDDDPSFSYLLRRIVEKEGFTAQTASSGKEAFEQVESKPPSIVFLDLMMPGMSGFEVLDGLRERKLTAPVVVITAFGSIDNAVKSMHMGAADYITKPIDNVKVQNVLRNLMGNADIGTGDGDLEGLHGGAPDAKHVLLGSSPQMQSIFKLIGAVSMTPNDIPVLITGESGTGKELISRAIHKNSSYPEDPFVPINCTALPETLLESELFGHEVGAFSGASDRRKGRFEHAQKGTIFLDEIGDLSPALQQKLLRVLQDREYERLGGNETLQIRARFIAATNQDLNKLVADGNFREDLLFRLRVFDIQVAPLRARKEDIRILAKHFLNRNAKLIGKSIEGISEEAMEILLDHDYPGNVRELENIIRKAAILTSGKAIVPNDIALKKEAEEDDQESEFEFPFFTTNFIQAREYFTAEFESQYVNTILKKYKGNISVAATNCGMTRQNMQRLIHKHKIDVEYYRNL